MPGFSALLPCLASILDQVVRDPVERDRIKLELLALNGSPEIEALAARLAAIAASHQTRDPWTSRARPGFLYVMYAMILLALPMGVIGAFSPETARAMAASMHAYLGGLPEPLYALFATGYIGYAAMRQWGKVKGVDT